MENRSIDRRLFLVTGSALTLSACGNLLGPGEAPQIYTLRPTLPALPQGAPVSWALAVAIPDASASLDTQRIALTRSGTTMDYYANAAWPDALTVLVQTALLSAFQDSGRIAAREQDAIHADYTLVTDIRDFTAHYDDPDGALRATVTIVAQMTAAHGRKVVASLTATQSVRRAAANSVDAAVQAFDAAFGAAIAQIVPWALALPPPTRQAIPRLRAVLELSRRRRISLKDFDAEFAMLRWALIFLAVGLIAGLLGFTGIAGTSIAIAKTLFFVFIVIFLVLLLAGLTVARKVSGS